MTTHEFIGTKTQARCGSRCQILDEYICSGGHVGEQCMILGLLYIKPDRLLPAVEPNEIGTFPLNEGIIATGEITFWALDLDHASSSFRKPPRGIWGRNSLLQGDNCDAFEVPHRQYPHIYCDDFLTAKHHPGYMLLLT